MPRRKEPRIPDALLDQLLAGADAKTAFDPDGLLDDLKKALAERVLNAEMDHHLAGEELGNRRNGYVKKTVVTDTGKIELEVLRDRQTSFDPTLLYDAIAHGLPMEKMDALELLAIYTGIDLGSKDAQDKAQANEFQDIIRIGNTEAVFKPE